MNRRDYLRRALYEKARLEACLAALAAYADGTKDHSVDALVHDAREAFLFYEIGSGIARHIELSHAKGRYYE